MRVNSKMSTVYKACLFSTAAYTPAEQGYIKVDGATQLICFDSFLCFEPQRSALSRLFAVGQRCKFTCQSSQS